jgi:hypothetical protein
MPMNLMSFLTEDHHAEEKAAKPKADTEVDLTGDVTWEAFHPNLVMTAGADGRSLMLSRTKYSEHDAALGQAITTGCLQWTVRTPNSNANTYVGVASARCEKRTYPAATQAWAMYLHDGDLCSAAAPAVARPGASVGFTRLDGTRGYMDTGDSQGLGARNREWVKWALRPIPTGTPIQAILDMEQRTLSFAVGDAEPQVAYTNLPGVVHPYICCGDVGERSLLEVSGSGVHTSI